LSNLGGHTEDAAAQAFQVAAKCQLASESLSRPSGQASEGSYRHHLADAIALALSIKDEFYQGLAIRQVINLCRSANDFEIARALYKGVEHDRLREQIARDAPELAGEKPLPHEETTVEPAVVHLDGLDRETVIRVAAKAMRDAGASEREIDGFKGSIAEANFETVLANAIAWGAPVRFLMEGRPWVPGDLRRLTVWQRVQRILSLWRGSYVHPDGTVELRGQERANRSFGA
jgi:hypothetical protein